MMPALPTRMRLVTVAMAAIRISGRGADDGVVAVVLGHPEAVVAQRLAVLGERDRVADRHPVRASDDGDRLVEH